MATPSEQPVEQPPVANEAPATTETTAEASTEDAPQPETEEDIKSRKVTLADLSAKGTALYAHKSYEEAAEIFSEASVLQAEINGEMAPENAEILFHYGRSLFKVGQSKSDVLGATAGGDKPASAKPKQKKPAASKPAETDAEKVTQEGVSLVAEKKDGESIQEAAAKKAETDAPAPNKPLFQFTGDENFDEDSDEEDGPADGEEQEEEDDLATAFEILDLARVCYLKLLAKAEEESANDKGKEVSEGDSPSVRHIKERLADTHDCLAEISLENERYPAAIEDGRTSLKYKMELYPEESEILAEAHYKLSLALEFASVTVSNDDGAPAKREAMDQDLRDEAVQEMELAIKSFKLKMQNREVDVATMASPEDNELARKGIQEMKEVIADMEQRLVDLKADPIDAKGLLGDEANPLGGILGATLGESAAETKARVEEAKKTANDLSGLVRKKKAAPAETAAPEAAAPATSNGKRKADDDDEELENGATKKAKTEAEAEA
ncbi:hypothetical protein NLU13_6556 [Sarocladium strictum]|uniref:Tetratricopeptide SHNi-TPR domain-containing protein n=1 Tax=Sarocladium strictum TaxID=5046 RepID=A0AA39GGG4_SARSR|nr:hypothetical protein NLU13_6556 [Sarocladium strictum]